MDNVHKGVCAAAAWDDHAAFPRLSEKARGQMRARRQAARNMRRGEAVIADALARGGITDDVRLGAIRQLKRRVARIGDHLETAAENIAAATAAPEDVKKCLTELYSYDMILIS